MLKINRPFNGLKLLFGLGLLLVTRTGFSQYKYPFQNPALPTEDRITNLLSLMTLDEKVSCLGTNPTIVRLGVKGTGHVEGLHGLAMGLPGGWGRKTPVPTTIFPQSIGMAETWDPDLLQQAGKIS